MPFPTITKRGWPGGVVPNVVDYDAARAAFSWEQARAALDGLPDGRGLNIAHEAVDRHAAGPARRDHVAFRWLHRDGSATDTTYAELQASTNRFANVLAGLGVGPGERVFTLLGRVPELYVDRARDAEEHQRALPAVLRLRARVRSSSASSAATAGCS